MTKHSYTSISPDLLELSPNLHGSQQDGGTPIVLSRTILGKVTKPVIMHKTAHGECYVPIVRDELVPNMGAGSLEQQRDYLLRYYVQRGAIDPADPTWTKGFPLQGIFAMRNAALTPYVESVRKRLRMGAYTKIATQDGKVLPEDIFKQLQAKDGQERDELLTRIISRDRVQQAMYTASDRDGDSNTGYYGGKLEKLAMHEYGVVSPADVTYVSTTKPDSKPISVPKGQALLVYAQEALQAISPQSERVGGSGGFHMFIDPRLKASALLTIAESPEQRSFTGMTALQGLFDEKY